MTSVTISPGNTDIIAIVSTGMGSSITGLPHSQTGSFAVSNFREPGPLKNRHERRRQKVLERAMKHRCIAA